MRSLRMIIRMVAFSWEIQELWIGEAWLGGFLPIFFVFTAFDLNTIDERYTCTHQG